MVRDPNPTLVCLSGVLSSRTRARKGLLEFEGSCADARKAFQCKGSDSRMVEPRPYARTYSVSKGALRNARGVRRWWFPWLRKSNEGWLRTGDCACRRLGGLRRCGFRRW